MGRPKGNDRIYKMVGFDLTDYNLISKWLTANGKDIKDFVSNCTKDAVAKIILQGRETYDKNDVGTALPFLLEKFIMVPKELVPVGFIQPNTTYSMGINSSRFRFVYLIDIANYILESKEPQSEKEKILIMICDVATGDAVLLRSESEQFLRFMFEKLKII